MTRRSRTREWPSDPKVLIAGTVTDVIASLVSDARSRDIDIWSPAEPEPEEGWRANVVVAVIRNEKHASTLGEGMRLMRSVNQFIADNAVKLVIDIHGAAKLGDNRIVRWLGDEILYQIQLAVQGDPETTRPRRWRAAVGLASLNALGIDVLRVGRMT